MLTGLRIPAHSPVQQQLKVAIGFRQQQQQSRTVRVNSWSAPSFLVRGSANESGGGNAVGAQNARDPSVDTRIHWGSSDEGWVGGSEQSRAPSPDVTSTEEILSRWRSDRNEALLGILVKASDSHYKYLELTPDAEAEEIKAAYRRLSKTYHPDTTSLPLDVAADKFVRLKEAYTVLSSVEQRRVYDWQLAQKFMPKNGSWSTGPSEYGKTMADDGTRIAEAWDSDSDFIDNPVDTLGGRNMKLSAQTQVAIAFDAFAIIVSILCILYVLLFKQT